MSRDDIEDFRSQCRRQMARPVADRIRYGFFRNPNPVRDANRNIAFRSMGEYRQYCERAYPAYYGYARPREPAALLEEFRREFEKRR